FRRQDPEGIKTTIDLDLYRFFFLAPTTLGILGGVVAVELACYALYSFQGYNPSRRSRLLQPMLVSWLFFWSFVGTSFLACSMLLQNYWENPQLTIRTVLGS